MFGLSFGEILVVAVIALIFIGPKQLPEVARALAKLINELKRAMGDISGDFFQHKNKIDAWARDFSAQIVNTTNNENQVSPPSAPPQTPVVEPPPAPPVKKEDENK